MEQDSLEQVSSLTAENNESHQAEVDCLKARLDRRCDNLDSASVMQTIKEVRIGKQLVAVQAELVKLDRKESQRFRDSNLKSG